MSEGPWTILTEYRHWRASVCVGLVIGAVTGLAAVGKWPVLTQPSRAFTPAFTEWIDVLSPNGLLFVGLATSVLLGSWWCGLVATVLAHLQMTVLRRLPFENEVALWPKRKARLCLVPLSTIRKLQQVMSRTGQYGDLQICDRRGAFLIAIEEALAHPGGGEGAGREMVRAQTDLRLIAGLQPWLPLLLWQVAGGLLKPLNALQETLQVLSIIVALFLMVAVISLLRRCNALLLGSQMNEEMLGRCARDAVNSGRSHRELADAQSTTK